jgi:SAM-dependent methyltransferase
VINDENTYGVDIDIPINIEEDNNLKIYNGYELPYNDDTFTYVSLFQTLHHVHEDMLHLLIQNISITMINVGYLIIKEHDVYDDEIRKLVEIEDILHNIINNNYYEYLNTKSSIEWTNILLFISVTQIIDMYNYFLATCCC